MMKKRFTAFAIAMTMVVGMLAGCGTGGDPAASTSTDAGAGAAAGSGGTVNIVLWHSMGGVNEKAVLSLVDKYNASQSAVRVEAQYQGSYDDAMTKLRATPAGSGPDIMQLYDIGTRWMIDSGYALVMQDFIDKDQYDISDYEPNILSYYTVAEKLYSMPFNCSTPCLLYNKEAFDKAGIDITKMTDMAALQDAAKVLTEQGGMKTGGALPVYSWIFEQMLSLQGKNYADNDNGRTARAASVDFDKNGAGLAVLNMWKDFASQSYTGTFGTGTNDTKKEFTTGTLGFIMDSCSAYLDVQNAASGVFTVGLAPLPSAQPGDQGGVSVGGGSLWIMDNQSDEKAQAAWDFIKYATQPEQQADWAINTGYLPIRKSATDLPVYQEYINNVNPDFLKIVDSLRSSKSEYSGAVLGVFSKARSIVENEIMSMINDSAKQPADVLATIAKQINDEIEMYNKTNS